MAWTATARRQYGRRNLRYPSDLTDAEWTVIEPMMPPPSRLGRPRKTDEAHPRCASLSELRKSHTSTTAIAVARVLVRVVGF